MDANNGGRSSPTGSSYLFPGPNGEGLPLGTVVESVKALPRPTTASEEALGLPDYCWKNCIVLEGRLQGRDSLADHGKMESALLAAMIRVDRCLFCRPNQGSLSFSPLGPQYQITASTACKIHQNPLSVTIINTQITQIRTSNPVLCVLTGLVG